MSDLITTVLDALGLLAVATGTGALAAAGFALLWRDHQAAVALSLFGAGILVAGLVLTGGSVLMASRTRPAKARAR